MRTSTGILATACLLWAALLVTGCADGGGAPRPGPALLLHPAAAHGPDPFTRSTATTPATPAAPPRTPSAPRTLSGGTPGLYGGTRRTLSCDVERQTDLLTADPARADAFARAIGVTRDELSAYLHSLTPVVLRADTRVTDHGYRAPGRVLVRQAVLQAGTAVLVDERGLPRLRCACGNPLTPPLALPRGTVTKGRPWPSYRPEGVVVVTRAPRVMGGLTLLDLVDGGWLERRLGHAVRHDRRLPPPARTVEPVTPQASVTPQAPVAPVAPVPSEAPVTPSAPARPADTPVPEFTPEAAPDSTPEAAPDSTPESASESAPESVPDTPDLPDGGGLIPDATDDPVDPLPPPA
ncbi:DUF6777 domain-containing protein [Streptomyces flavalbus]|uniref:DUF6777 domain-containing protein n=1 Tax=Streptomyces flavalbus TaxID=2665155 RepID=A0ABW2WKI7_9ACTN